MKKYDSLRARILENCYFDDNDCWNWKLQSRGSYGTNKLYGGINVRVDIGGGKPKKHKKRLVHVVMWEIENNKPLPTGMQLNHLCNNPRCCNPKHLKLCTMADNNYYRDILYNENKQYGKVVRVET